MAQAPLGPSLLSLREVKSTVMNRMRRLGAEQVKPWAVTLSCQVVTDRGAGVLTEAAVSWRSRHDRFWPASSRNMIFTQHSPNTSARANRFPSYTPDTAHNAEWGTLPKVKPLKECTFAPQNRTPSVHLPSRFPSANFQSLNPTPTTSRAHELCTLWSPCTACA